MRGPRRSSRRLPVPLVSALKAAGYEFGKRGNIDSGEKDGAWHVPFETLLADGAKSDLIATQANANAEHRFGTSPLGIDARHVFPHVSQTPISVDETKITFLAQTTRTLPTIANIERALDASSTKEIVDTVAALTTLEPAWQAVFSNPQSIALFSKPDLRSLLDSDMALAVRRAIDYKLVAAIDAATTNTMTQTTETLVEAIYAAALMVANDGFSPKIVVMKSSVGSTLALTRTATIGTCRRSPRATRSKGCSRSWRPRRPPS